MKDGAADARLLRVLAVVVTILVVVVGVFAWLLADGPVPPALYHCGTDGCPRPH